MPKRRKKRKPARPPLTKLDEWLYFTGAAIFIVAIIASLFGSSGIIVGLKRA